MSFPIPKIVYGDADTEVVFDFPAVSDDGESLDAAENVSTSISGMRQVSIDYVQVLRDLTFSFVTPALKEALQSFFSSYAVFGKPFKFFEDKAQSEFVYYELADFKFKPKKVTGKVFYPYEIPFKFRRVLGFVQGDTDVTTILNDQSTPVDLVGVIFDKLEYTSAIIVGELRRRVDGEELLSTLTLTAQYREPTDDWIITQGPDVSENPIGVEFSITAYGQVQYISSDLVGDDYLGVYKIKQSKFTA